VITRIAAFDFDGTITDRDTLMPFVRLVAGRRRFLEAIAASGLGALARGRMETARDLAKGDFLRRALGGLSHDALIAEGERYSRQVLEQRVRPPMRRLIEWHIGNGHEVLIVSAGLDSYLSHVSGALGASTAICSTLAVDEEGVVTGELIGGNCRGAEKVARIRSHLDGRNAEVWAYGNSSGDEAMLAFADHGYRVDRNGRLRPAR
jgi:phosphatidylglycerophosphatase C